MAQHKKSAATPERLVRPTDKAAIALAEGELSDRELGQVAGGSAGKTKTGHVGKLTD
ncbi:MAG TPA: hypothetical protein VMT54_11225 [Candidatus Cybelea sp.]|nr:hypothetical protein [Candidatus Cybelea sp.]